MARVAVAVEPLVVAVLVGEEVPQVAVVEEHEGEVLALQGLAYFQTDLRSIGQILAGLAKARVVEIF